MLRRRRLCGQRSAGYESRSERVLMGGQSVLFHSRAGAWEPVRLPVTAFVRGFSAGRMTFIVSVLATLAGMAGGGCLEPGSMVCGDGRICPAGSRCDVAGRRCVTSSQESACDG